MSTKSKSEIKWILLAGVCSFALTFLVLSEFENYNWTLGLQHSEILWILWIFISGLCLIGGIIYFIRILINKGRGGLENRLTIFFLMISAIGLYQIGRVISRLDKYLLPTSEKTEEGFTIYPPLSATGEQWEQLVGLKNQAHLVFGFAVFLSILLMVTVFITLKKRKTAPNNTYN